MEYQPRKGQRKPIRNLFSKIMVWVIFLTFLSFYVVVFYFIWNYRTIPDAVIYGFSGVIFGEFGFLAGIRIKEKKDFNNFNQNIV